MNRRHLYAACVGIALVGVPVARSWGAEQDPYAALAAYDEAKGRAPLALIEEEVRKAAPPQRQEIEAKLLAVAQDAKASAAGRQAALRLLARVASPRSVPVAAGLLSDEKLSHLARAVLQGIDHPTASAALVGALGQTTGKLRIGIISTLGDRRDASAVGRLEQLAGDLDEATAVAAIEALGDIANAAAWQALELAKVAQPLRDDLERAQLAAARQRVRSGMLGPDLVNALTRLAGSADPAVRASATKGLIHALDAEGAAAAALEALDQDLAVRDAALDGVGTAKAETRRLLASRLPALPPEKQAALLPVLADAADVDMREALVKVAAAGDAAAAPAAVAALLRHGTAEDVELLVDLASKTAPASGPAREVLRRLGADGVNDRLAKLAEEAEGAKAAAAVKALVERRADAALPTLIKVAGGTGPAATEAAAGLATLGSAAQLPQLVSIVLEGQPNARRAAGAAIAKIAGKSEEKSACSAAVLEGLGRAKDVEARRPLLASLSAIGDAPSLEAVNRLIASDAALREDAIRQLADWPSAAAAPALFELAQKGASEKEQVLALRGFIKVSAASRDKLAAERVGMLKQAMDVATRPDEKRLALAALAEVPSLEALEFLASKANDPALGQEASVAAIKLARNLGLVHRKQALATLARVKAANAAVAGQADEAIAAVEKMGEADGYVVAWMLAGPFTAEGKGAGELFDTKFAPETAGAAVKWQPVFLSDAKDRRVHLDRLLGGGNDRVAYLRAVLTSPKAQRVLLELGSDDGVKAFLNGAPVHANNATRALSEASDKVKLDLREGANVLLLKITQGGGEWQAMARLKAEDGGKLEGVTVGAE